MDALLSYVSPADMDYMAGFLSFVGPGFVLGCFPLLVGWLIRWANGFFWPDGR